MPTALFPDVLERAFRVSAEAHRKQTRKASGIPYICHPTAVCSILQNAGVSDANVLAAAVLHDVVEDTPLTLSDLTDQFPDEVVELVSALPEKKKSSDGRPEPWKKRKQEHITRVASVSTSAKNILLADKLHNLVSSEFDNSQGSDVWERFNAAKTELLWYYKEIIKSATVCDDTVNQRLVEQCQSVMASLFQNE